MPGATTQQLKRLGDTIIHRPPCHTGTVPVQEDDLIIYYGKAQDEQAWRLNTLTAPTSALERLAAACDPATFGRNDEDVLDESYRKAGKLDARDFAVRLDLEFVGLLDVVRAQLLPGRDLHEDVYAQLYKLNVYGEGSFFKSHRDTPRGGSMIGTLVIIYPTTHEGGALVLRDRNEEWTFDSAKAVTEGAASGPCVAYTMFYSDVEHEVTEVLKGYRVTVTYNLYVVDRMKPISEALATARTADTDAAVAPVHELHASALSTSHLHFQSALEQLLADASFLPDGGALGFGLRRVYPLERIKSKGAKSATGESLRNGVDLGHLTACLKGADRDVLRVCDALGLRTSLYVVYRGYRGWNRKPFAVLVPSMPLIEGFSAEMDMLGYLVRRYGAKRVDGVEIDGDDESENEDDGEYEETDGEEGTGQGSREGNEVDLDVDWVTKPTAFNVLTENLVAYGNEAELSYMYGYIAMVAEVGKPGERGTLNGGTEE